MKNKTLNPLNEIELLQSLSQKKATTYNVNDLFANEIEFSEIDKVMAIVALCPQHTFQIATKNADRMKAYFESVCGDYPNNRWFGAETLYFKQIVNLDIKHNPPLGSKWLNEYFGNLKMYGKLPFTNLWLGVQIENQEQADSQIPLLLKIPAAVRFVLCKPLLSRVDFEIINERVFNGNETSINCLAGYESQYNMNDGHVIDIPIDTKIDLVIVDGANGKNAQPMHPNWVRSIRNQCKAANVPFYFKGWGEWLPVEKRGEYWYVNSGATTYTRAYLAENHIFDENNYAAKVGKKLSGYLLDGIEYKELPK